ncbi:MAG: AAA family ATPase [Acidimicrobiales bacterium]
MRNPRILVLDREPELAEQIRGVAAEMRPRPEVTAYDRVGSAEEQIASGGPFEVIVAGPSLATKAGLSRLQAIHDEAPGTSLVLAFGEHTETQLRDIVRTGALDILQIPVADRSLATTLERAVACSRTRTAESVTSHSRTPAADGTVYTVASATGGCGKTFYATNLAYFLHSQTGKRTCLVDLDLQFGEVSTALRLRPTYTIADALAREDEDGTGLADHLGEYVVSHATGFSVLAAPKDPSEADRIHPSDVARVIEAARSRYDYVIVDTPAALTEIVLAAFDQSDQLFTMATLDLPSVRNMSVFLNTLDKLKIPADNVKLILNKAERDVGIDVDDISRLFPQGFSSVLPYAREVSKSVNIGTPILAFNPASEVSLRMAAGLATLLPDGGRQHAVDVAAVARHPRQSLFARMFRPILHPTGS